MPGNWLLEGHREAQFAPVIAVTQKPLAFRGGSLTNVRTKPTKEIESSKVGRTTFLRKSQSSHVVIKPSTATTTTPSNKKKISPGGNSNEEQRSVSFDTTITASSSSSSSSSPPRISSDTITHEESLTTIITTTTSDILNTSNKVLIDTTDDDNAPSSSSVVVSSETMAVLKQLPNETIRQQALRLLSLPPLPNQCGKATVKFNHYNKAFPIHNSVMQWEDVDEEYSFSFVFKGNYPRNIFELLPRNPLTEVKQEGVCMLKDEIGDYFVGMVPGKPYEVIVEEDPVAGIGGIEGLRLVDGPLKASSSTASSSTSAKTTTATGGGNGGLRSGNSAVQGITQELLAMDVGNLHSEEARRLREARDIEDVLFS